MVAVAVWHFANRNRWVWVTGAVRVSGHQGSHPGRKGTAKRGGDADEAWRLGWRGVGHGRPGVCSCTRLAHWSSITTRGGALNPLTRHGATTTTDPTGAGKASAARGGAVEPAATGEGAAAARGSPSCGARACSGHQAVRRQAEEAGGGVQAAAARGAASKGQNAQPAGAWGTRGADARPVLPQRSAGAHALTLALLPPCWC